METKAGDEDIHKNRSSIMETKTIKYRGNGDGGYTQDQVDYHARKKHAALKWVPGNMSWGNEGGWCDTDHITC